VFGLKFHWQSFQRHIALIGAVLLGAIGTILVDARMYLSAGVFGFLSIGGLVWFVVLLLRAHQENKERERRVRIKKTDKLKAKVADATRRATGSAVKVAGLAKAQVVGAFKRARFWHRKNRAE
jgi:hypothetical protein